MSGHDYLYSVKFVLFVQSKANNMNGNSENDAQPSCRYSMYIYSVINGNYDN